MRRLIINADDFGLTPGVNRGICSGMQTGIVTSTTIMAVGGGFSDGIAQLQALCSQTPDYSPEKPSPKLSLGCHVVLADGVPLLPSQTVPSLVGGPGGEFRTSFSSFACRALCRRINEEEVAAEAEQQIRKTQGAGLALAHVDTHKHLHLLPAVLRPVLRAAQKCGIRAIRNPFAPVKPLAFAHLSRRPRLWTRYGEVKLLRGWQQSFQRAVREAGLQTTDGTFGIVSTGALDLELFRAIMGSIPEGTWEFCCHPGRSDDDLARVRTRLRESRDRELAVLTSSEARAIVRQYGIELISYWDL